MGYPNWLHFVQQLIYIVKIHEEQIHIPLLNYISESSRMLPERKNKGKGRKLNLATFENENPPSKIRLNSFLQTFMGKFAIIFAHFLLFRVVEAQPRYILVNATITPFRNKRLLTTDNSSPTPTNQLRTHPTKKPTAYPTKYMVIFSSSIFRKHVHFHLDCSGLAALSPGTAAQLVRVHAMSPRLLFIRWIALLAGSSRFQI